VGLLPVDLLIVLAFLAVLLAGYRVSRYLSERGRPSRGDAGAYDGNLLPPGDNQHSPGGGHTAHGGAHGAHGGMHGGGHTGHGGFSGGGGGHH
jgi:hypothetical protein